MCPALPGTGWPLHPVDNWRSPLHSLPQLEVPPACPQGPLRLQWCLQSPLGSRRAGHARGGSGRGRGCRPHGEAGAPGTDAPGLVSPAPLSAAQLPQVSEASSTLGTLVCCPSHQGHVTHGTEKEAGSWWSHGSAHPRLAPPDRRLPDWGIPLRSVLWITEDHDQVGTQGSSPLRARHPPPETVCPRRPFLCQGRLPSNPQG